MWPFHKRSPIVMPDWRIQPITLSAHDVCFAEGHWLATDGGRHLENAVSLGLFAQCDGTITFESGENSTDGPRALALNYLSSGPPSFHEVVVDSGYIVLFCRDAADAAAVTDKTWENLQYRVIEEATRASATLLLDAAGVCVGLFLAPNYGDGTYALDYQEIEGGQRLRVELELSN